MNVEQRHEFVPRRPAIEGRFSRSRSVYPAPYPLEADRGRDHGTTATCAAPAATRKYLGELFELDVTTTIVAQRVRSGALDQPG